MTRPTPIDDGDTGLSVRTKLNEIIDDYLSIDDNLDTDVTLAANSDAKVPSQKAVKTYVDALINAINGMVLEGSIDCSGNPNYPAADAGHVYIVSVAGKIGGASGPTVEVGEALLCLVDSTASGNHATVGGSWTRLQVNLVGALTQADIGTLVQAYSAKLAAIVAETWADNKMIVLTGAGTLALFDTTPYGRGLLNASDADAAKTYLEVTGGGGGGLTEEDADLLYLRLDNVDTDEALTANSDSKVASQQATKAYVDALATSVGTNKQDKDATLTAIAAMTTTANHIPYWTGTDTIDSFVTTSYTRGLMNAADEAAWKALVNLEIGVDVQAFSTALSTYASGTVSGRTIDTAANTVSNIALSMFAAGVVDTDVTLAANSDSKLASQKATKAYVDGVLDRLDALQYKGGLNCSANPNYPAASAGHFYVVTHAGKIGGASGITVEIGDSLICGVDSSASGDQATVGANWGILQFNLTGALTTASIGTLVQAYSALLAAFVAAGASANTVPFWVNGTTMSLLTVSSFWQGVLDDSDLATAQASLGIEAGGSFSASQALALQMVMQF